MKFPRRLLSRFGRDAGKPSLSANLPPATGEGSALPGSVKIGYNLAPGWTHQWHTIQRHLVGLREQYRDTDVHGNLDVEQTVDALLIALNHLYDWLHQDSTLPLSQPVVEVFVKQHPTTLGLVRDYADTRKHMKRRQPSDQIAQITSISIDSNGYKATIGHWPGNQPALIAEVDALDLAERSEKDWRALLTAKGISIPS